MPAMAASCLAVRVHGMAGDEYQQEAGGPIGLTATATAQRCSTSSTACCTHNCPAAACAALLSMEILFLQKSSLGKMTCSSGGKISCIDRRKPMYTG
jgi:hypothetical protein